MSGDSAYDLDLAVSALGADGQDVQLMMRLLTEKLSGALGDRIQIERSGGRFRRSNEIQRVQVRVGSSELEARLVGAAPEFTIGKISGGIRIRTERTDAASWVRLLLEALQVEAGHSANARQALESIVIGEP